LSYLRYYLGVFDNVASSGYFHVMHGYSPPVRTIHYTVQGMTCDHCVLSVTEEVSEVPGVETVDVDLASGSLAVSGEGFSPDQIKAAVVEAGYEAVER
jgi:copper chaperone CopZ